MPATPPALDALALVGDRRTVALVDALGTVVWYCPSRFDRPSLFGALVGPERGGAWHVEAPSVRSVGRCYVGDSAVLETRVATGGGVLTLADWMPMGDGLPRGLCRQASAAPAAWRAVLRPAPDYGRRGPSLERAGGAGRHALRVDGRHTLWASHPVDCDEHEAWVEVPTGEPAWFALLDDADGPDDGRATPPDADALGRWRDATCAAWQAVAERARYHGPYQDAVAASLRAIRLLTYSETGAVVSAPTTSLPEVPGGERNYDYRYAWLRDAGMIASALTRAGSDGTDERRFLDFVAGVDVPEGEMLAPLYAVDGRPAPPERGVPLDGYRESRPVQVGNAARGQVQFGAYANVLFAAKLLYDRFDTREHWPLTRRLADALAERWREPDAGIWEEREPRQYTTSKVIAATALEYVAEHADADDAARWRAAAADVRAFVAAECLTSEGAYAAEVGGEAVDVSAALFPVWAYCDPDTPEMVATMDAIERDLRAGPRHLYRRHLTQSDAGREGAFLAGTLWVAQYWVMRDVTRARQVLDDVLGCATDLGFLSEEVDPASRRLLGNIPQSFVHAALIGTAYDLGQAEGGR